MLALLALAGLLACHPLRRTHPRLLTRLAAASALFAGLALLAGAGHGFHGIRAVLGMAGGAGLTLAGLYLASLSLAAKRTPPYPRSGDVLGQMALPAYLLSHPGKIKPDFSADRFGLSDRRADLLALAHRPSTSPEFSSILFAAALSWYGQFPRRAADDGVTRAELDLIADGLFLLESRQPSAPPERADDYLRSLLQYGRPGAPWRGHATEALLDNAAALANPCDAARTARFVLIEERVASAAYRRAAERLADYLRSRREMAQPHRQDMQLIAETTDLAAMARAVRDPLEQDAPLAELALAVFRARLAQHVAAGDDRHLTSALLAGMTCGAHALAQESMHALCGVFERIVTENMPLVLATLQALYRHEQGSRPTLFAACLQRVVPIVAAVAPDVPGRARVEVRDEWWF